MACTDWNIQDGYAEIKSEVCSIRVWFLGNGVVRVRRSVTGEFPEQSPILLRTAWEDRYDNLLAGERIRVTALVPEEPSTCPASLTLALPAVRSASSWSASVSALR